jgi:HK97 gp10 family phage protein
MNDLVNVKGLAELQKLLNTLPAKMEANVLRGALRSGAKVVMEQAKQNAPIESGTMKDGLKISTSNRRGVVSASVKARGPHGFLAHFHEYGTQPHTISGKKGGMLNINGTLIPSVEHPGIKPRPFMRPALDARAQDALVETGEYIKKRLAKKHGLDTEDILIESDDE